MARSVAVGAAQWQGRPPVYTSHCPQTKDTNSGFLAALLFDLGIQLKRTEVIADDTDEIVEAVQRMHRNYDIVFTGGGIGPTHDGESRARDLRWQLVRFDC